MSTNRQDLQHVIEGQAVKNIRQQGPQTTSELVQILLDEQDVYVRVNGIHYKFPEGELQWILEESDKVTKGTDRWHLTNKA